MATEPSALPWRELNQQHLAAALAQVRVALKHHVESRAAKDGEAGAATSAPAASTELVPAPPMPDGAPPAALDSLCNLFRLSPFERDVLLLCAGVELEADFSALCAEAQGDAARPHPTFSLALAALPDSHWSALSPAAPLRRRRLIEVGAGTSLTLSPLRIDERILNCLVGINHLDERLMGLVDPVPIPAELVPSQQSLAEQIAAIWSQPGSQAIIPAIQLCGPEFIGKRNVAATACALVGLNLGVITAETLPTAPAELETLLRLWEREAALTKSALLLEGEELGTGDTARIAAFARTIERVNSVILIATPERHPMRQRPMITFEVAKPTLHEQRVLWRQTLGTAAQSLNGHLETLTSQFDVTDQVIRAAGAQALGQAAQRHLTGDGGPDEGRELAGLLWESCRVNSRPRLDDLAQRIDAKATWDDLILPEGQRLILRDVAAHVRKRYTVYEKWGFAGKGSRGLGISALFAGTSGTGKTMSAEVLARELSLDLYRIDLSAVVSKYIGESEKNLRRVFDAAEEGGSILLFDEADALFGKRSETKDSHDRYANIEVSYLLQRMESYRGLAILTTNLKKSLDVAFLRRLRFVVEFPFPDHAQRSEIWRRAFPAEMPQEGLDFEKLGRLNVAGGNIRNAALNAAFFAADMGEPVRMTHCYRAAQSEYSKLEKTLTQAEVAGWV
jgi:hypothetical protein